VTDGDVNDAAKEPPTSEDGQGDGQHSGAQHAPEHPTGKALAGLALGALGVVYGDIGTSPLYSMREALNPEHGLAVTETSVLGVLSLIVWALILVVTVKYLIFVLRADNHGQGGILALTALVAPLGTRAQGQARFLVLLGIFAAALEYGDGMITPSISVLSAIEGLGLAAPGLEPYVIPITIAVLIGLFLFQPRGTAGVGRIFGPITLVWFFVIGGLGIHHVLANPSVLRALNPAWAVGFFVEHGLAGVAVLGSVFLAVTGGEALYSDLGHFGKRPIRVAWFGLVLPALLLNYFGQGALILARPEVVDNPFFRMAPSWALLPLVVIATAATIIASQALISGAFSLTFQAIQLGWLPRVRIDHTSAQQIGQIYVPAVNWVLMVACIGLVLGFQTSAALASAYGVAVTTTMIATTLLFGFVAHHRWGWPFLPAAALTATFLLVEVSFFGANILKVAHGGWFPLAVGTIVFTGLLTWKRGKEILGERLGERAKSRVDLLAELQQNPPHRVEGTAVFMFSDPRSAPPALLHNLRHNHVLHERVVLLAVVTEEIPNVPRDRRAQAEPLGQGFWQVVLRYGFMDVLQVPQDLCQTRLGKHRIRPSEVTYFLGQETILPSDHPGMAMWREHLFAAMNKNKRSAASYFGLPPEQVVELGTQIEI
jgi:KUP system potassium uptake protein